MTLSVNSIDSATQQAISAFVRRITLLYAVHDVILYGSRAQGDFHDESDIDLAVILTGSCGDFVATKLVLSDIAYDVLLDHDWQRVEALPIWMDEWTHADSVGSTWHFTGCHF